jgi:hypothetical protein
VAINGQRVQAMTQARRDKPASRLIGSFEKLRWVHHRFGASSHGLGPAWTSSQDSDDTVTKEGMMQKKMFQCLGRRMQDVDMTVR